MTNPRMIEALILESIFFVTCIPFLCCFCLETDTITSGLFIKDPDTIVSRGNVFKLGFFTPNNSTNRYLGVFYTISEHDVIWVANRDNPLNDSSGSLTMSEDGNLVLNNGRNQTLWSTNATMTSPLTTSVQILDTGNLVLRNNPTGATIWESFSYPTNVYVPRMTTSYNIYTGKKVFLSSWENESVPEVGGFTSGITVSNNIPQNFVWNNGRPYWRSGPWNGELFIGIKDMYSASLSIATVENDSAGNFYFSFREWRFLSKVVLNSSGSLAHRIWNDQKKNWDTLWSGPKTCDVYATCGPFGNCNTRDSPICSCLRGFEPTNLHEWGRENWTSGCRRINQLQCNQTGGVGESGDRFFKLQFMKVPDFAQQFPATKKEECDTICLRNCSCIAYAYESNIGCMFWTDTLIDIQQFVGVPVDLYLRLSASDFDNHQYKKLVIIIPVLIVALVAIIFIALYWVIKRRGVKTKVNIAGTTSSTNSSSALLKDESRIINIKELPLFKFEMLANATDQFHDNNLLGKGGFGSVYKGKFANGEEVAVKRLSATFGQGMQEFVNEAIVVCKLQHRNLVKLLGCCIEKEEKMLIYECMPNKSLDIHLFDPILQSRNVLGWRKRFGIIEGIGRGLLYLHKDSRLKIIHRDLKPSNILLDEEWNPKISDFGMARIFESNEDHDNTTRVVGTYGYMSPEYAMEGRFSEKSDVYSFGVLMLEIVKGEKNTHYYNHEWSLSLLGCAWKLWSEDNGLSFADETIANPNFEPEIVRCIQIALLCVQEFPKDRPSIQTILSMLNREIVDLPIPEQPIFAEKWNGLPNGLAQIAGQVGYSVNMLSITMLDGR